MRGSLQVRIANLAFDSVAVVGEDEHLVDTDMNIVLNRCIEKLSSHRISNVDDDWIQLCPLLS